MRRWTIAGVILAVAAGGAAAVELGPRYFNLAEGYSLCPPAAASRVQQRAPSRTVSWTARDPDTGAIAWRLDASRQATEITAKTIHAGAETIRAEVAKHPGVQVELCTVITAAGGRQAIDLRLTHSAGGEIRGAMWQRQVSVLMRPNEMVTLVIIGPAGERDRLLAIHEAVLATVEVFNPDELAARREANLAAGSQVLAALTTEKLAAIVDSPDEWVLFLRDGQVGGCGVARDRLATVEGLVGMENRSWLMQTLPDGRIELVEVAMAISADRSVIDWTVTIHRSSETPVGSGEPTAVLRMRKRGRTLQFTPTIGGQPAEPTEIALTEAMDRAYLPMGLQTMVGRLVDLSAPAAYAFAGYSVPTRALEVHTFTVVGPETIGIGGKKVQAVRATIQAAEDMEAQSLWLDADGRLWREEIGPDEFAVRSTRQEVLERFPPAKELLERIDADAAAHAAEETEETP